MFLATTYIKEHVMSVITLKPRKETEQLATVTRLTPRLVVVEECADKTEEGARPNGERDAKEAVARPRRTARPLCCVPAPR